MTADEIYRVRTALKERALAAERVWEKLKDCNCDDPEKAEKKEAAAEKYQAAMETLRMYDGFRF